MAQTEPIISQQKRRTCPFSKLCALSDISDFQQITSHISPISPITVLIAPKSLYRSLPYFVLSMTKLR